MLSIFLRSCALAIEDKLSECQQKLRETINIPGKLLVYISH